MAQPHAMATIPVIVADTDEEARRLLTSSQQATANVVRGRPGQLPPPVDVSEIERLLSPEERAAVAHRQMYAAVGSPATVRDRIESIIKRTQADELMITAMIYDQPARLRSFELAADVLGTLTIP
jgi:alkanesulfonate monooxygenase SsuD/methylene tetrahydromethanopterin reductase-like flavin-dependent oxidoreductase (luciferase family)